MVVDIDLQCDRCRGSGQERDMDSGRAIICRECSGSGKTEPLYVDEREFVIEDERDEPDAGEGDE